MENRKKNRLEEYDYSSNGMYFITICTKDRIPYFSEIIFDDIKSVKTDIVCKTVGADIIRPVVRLTYIGKILDYSINDIKNHYENVSVEKYCIMPDHIHLILSIMKDIDTAECGRMISAPTVSTIICSMKRYVSKESGVSIWQRSFHGHIIRSRKEFAEIWQYIENNPINWVNHKHNQNLWR